MTRAEVTAPDPQLTEPNPGANSVLGKAFLILECFDSGEASLSLAELARRSSLPKSTVHRVAASLVAWGALERVSGDFQLGLRLFEFGGLVPRWRLLRETALPFMEDLFEVTHQTVHLGQLDDLSVFYLEKIRGHNNLTTVSRIGGRVPAHCTGIGKVLLAFSPPEVLERLFQRPLERCSPYTITSSSVFRDELATIRKDGVAYDREETTLGLACVAAPILSYRGKPVAGISVSVPTARFRPEQLAPVVRAAALAVSRALKSTSIE